ncbi:MAG: proteasome accessory factor PafA2 family protein [bacterium]|nr:proteasome accessory factor PafA2 family protein [bacterium]
MHFPDRVYGIENEFGVTCLYSDGTICDIDELTSRDIHYGAFIKLKIIPHSVLAYGPGVSRLWHSNGGCTYIDTGTHPEHATPECRSIRDVIRFNKAGERICASIFEYPSNTNFRILLFKNNIGINEHGDIQAYFGCHENYLTYGVNAMKGDSTLAFIPFLITRQILDGCGWWLNKDSFFFSPRALSMNHALGDGTTGDRSIINKKGLGDAGDLKRLHLILGDANILEFSTYLKIGTTALVLSLIESGMTPASPCPLPVENMHELSRAYDPFAPLIHVDAYRCMSAFDIQTMYAQIVRKELTYGEFDSEETEAELKQVMLAWEQTLNAIYNRDTPWMLGRIDHVTKKFLGDKATARHPSDEELTQKNRLKDLDILYHGVTDRSLQERMDLQWHDRRIVSEQEILDAMIYPPRRTRATYRSAYVNLLARHNDVHAEYIDWPTFGVTTENSPNLFKCPDPFVCDDEKFCEFMEKAEKKYHIIS